MKNLGISRCQSLGRRRRYHFRRYHRGPRCRHCRHRRCFRRRRCLRRRRGNVSHFRNNEKMPEDKKEPDLVSFLRILRSNFCSDVCSELVHLVGFDGGSTC